MEACNSVEVEERCFGGVGDVCLEGEGRVRDDAEVFGQELLNTHQCSGKSYHWRGEGNLG